MFGRRRSFSSTAAVRAAVWGPVVLIVGLLWLDRAPVELERAEPRASHQRPTSDRGADVLLVVDWEAIAASGDTFSATDWSAAWLSTLEQTLGPTAVATPESLSREGIERARVVVLTQSVSDRLPSGVRDQLHRHVDRGALLVQCQPGGEMRQRYAADGEAGEKRGRQITLVDGVPEAVGEDLRQMPLFTDYIGSTAPREGAETLLAIDGAPAVYAVPAGDGHVVTIEFDVGEQLTSLQQGRPSESFDVRARSARETRASPPTIDALVADPALRGAQIPYADRLERFLVWTAIGRYEPLPGLWRFPAGAEGLLVPIHADRRLGDRAGWMLTYESRQGAASTLLTSARAGLTPAGAAVAQQRGGDVGLLWRRPDTPAERLEHVGVWGFEPLARPVSLGDQLEQLRPRLPDETVTAVKTATDWWSRDWTEPLERISSTSAEVDLSYEPERPGFAFGTGLPFRALDSSGLPLDVRESPVVLPAGRTATEAVQRYLVQSRQTFHQALVWRTDPDRFAAYPDLADFEAWADALDPSDRAGHAAMTLGEWTRFGRRRRESDLQSDFLDADRAELDEPNSAERILEIEGSTELEHPAVTVPRSPGEWSLERVRHLGGASTPESSDGRDVTLAGANLRRIPVDSGRFELEILYR